MPLKSFQHVHPMALLSCNAIGCTCYGIAGKQEKYVPYQMTKVPIEPHYVQYKGWQKDITRIKDHAALPEEMKTYIEFINEYLGVPVTYISNGPERDQIIKA